MMRVGGYGVRLELTDMMARLRNEWSVAFASCSVLAITAIVHARVHLNFVLLLLAAVLDLVGMHEVSPGACHVCIEEEDIINFG
jgi:hypothetical protein